MAREWLTEETLLKKLTDHKDGDRPYLGMYSSWYDGFVSDPHLMMLPIDDHMVHRGDGIFEAFRYSYGAFFDFEGHWQRLNRSAEIVKMVVPVTRMDLLEICSELVRPHKDKELIMRLYVSRGPGSFSPNPKDSVGSQLYVITTPINRIPENWIRQGVTCCRSEIPLKPKPFSIVKSCNYLPNVMMKMEAQAKKVDFSISMTDDGKIAEGATENLFIIDQEGVLKVPNLSYILRGTTLIHMLDLAEELKAAGFIKETLFTDISLEELQSAKEVGLVGTTISVLSVVEFAGQPINGGKPGEVIAKLRALLVNSFKNSETMRTPLIESIRE